jgi:hypothetical protein
MSKKATHIFFYTLHGPIKNRFIKHGILHLDASKYALIGATESHALPIKKKELYNTRNITIIDKINKIYKIYN